MAKQKFDLASKLRSLIEAEKNRRSGDRAKLLREQKRLMKALAKIEEALAQQETLLAEELTRAAAAAGVAMVGLAAEPASPSKKPASKKRRGKKKARRAHGSNVTWIAQQIASGCSTRIELCKAALKEGISVASISQSLSNLAEKGHVIKKGHRRKAVYSLPATTPAIDTPKKVVKKAVKKTVKKAVKTAVKKSSKK
jgi:hypothetical protein